MDIFDDDEDFDFLEEDEDLGADRVHAPPDVRVARSAASASSCSGLPSSRLLPHLYQSAYMFGY